MEKIKAPILLATLYLVIYTIASQIGMPVPFIVSMFMLGPFVTLWMVVRVLKDGKPSQYTFEDRFYEDLDYEPIKQIEKKEGAF